MFRTFFCLMDKSIKNTFVHSYSKYAVIQMMRALNICSCGYIHTYSIPGIPNSSLIASCCGTWNTFDESICRLWAWDLFCFLRYKREFRKSQVETDEWMWRKIWLEINRSSVKYSNKHKNKITLLHTSTTTKKESSFRV